MTATALATPTTRPSQPRTEVRPVWKTGLAAGVIAAAATTAIAGTVHAAGVSLDISGEPL